MRAELRTTFARSEGGQEAPLERVSHMTSASHLLHLVAQFARACASGQGDHAALWLLRTSLEKAAAPRLEVC